MLTDISLPDGLGLRPAQAQNAAFFERLFMSARDYFYQMPLPKDQVDALLRQQFHL